MQQQHEEEKQQQEEDKDMHIDEINDSEDEELIEIEGEQIEIERNEEIEGNNVSTCESINRFKKCCTKVKMMKTLFSCGNFHDQCGVLESFLMDPKLKEHRKKLNVLNEKDSLKIETFDNIAKIMSHSSPNKKGNLEVNKKYFRIVYLHQ